MNISIQHIGVRSRPERVVRVVARLNDQTIQAILEDDVVQRLCGSDASDENAISQALNRSANAIGIAIEAYVLARGLPFGGQIVLSWDDFSQETEKRPEAARTTAAD
jgi:hypothetical protein